jgi:peptidoglycan/LPS O-acetylase OafA/YrhL
MNSDGKAKSPSHDTRYYSLDIWRGVACLLIVINHATMYLTSDDSLARTEGAASKLIIKFFDHCWIGVPMFFVISGYCIVAACDGARWKPRAWKQYFFRRFKRIFPPYWVSMLGLFLIVSLLQLVGLEWLYFDNRDGIHPPSTFTLSQWIGNVTLTEGWRPHLFGDKSWFWYGTSWTLCYEEQFYAVCGLMLLLPRQHFFKAFAAVTAAVAGVSFANFAIHRLNIGGFFFDGRWLLFAAGCLVYCRVQYLKNWLGRVGDAALAGVCVGMVAWHMAGGTSFSEEYFVGFAFAVALSALYRWDRRLALLPAMRPLIYCGMMCYSLYLVHWPIVKLTGHLFYNTGMTTAVPTLLVSLPISFICALAGGWLFHLHVERRFLNTPPVEPWKLKHLSPSGVQGDLAPEATIPKGRLA